MASDDGVCGVLSMARLQAMIAKYICLHNTHLAADQMEIFCCGITHGSGESFNGLQHGCR